MFLNSFWFGFETELKQMSIKVNDQLFKNVPLFNTDISGYIGSRCSLQTHFQKTF